LNKLFGECQGAIIVHEVYDNGAAAKDGRLMPGDQILQVLTGDLLCNVCISKFITLTRK